MKGWYAVYDDDFATHKAVLVAEGEFPLRELERRFDAKASADAIDGRKVAAMWIIDQDTEQQDVIRCHGRPPGEIRRRYDAYMERNR